MNPTTIGVILFYAYPPGILLYDAMLKFLWKQPTITTRISEDVEMRALACLYMIFWTLGLGLHFWFGLFGGYPN